MRFRHPDTVHISTTIGGHSAIVGPDWRELPQALHQEALAKGCECDQGQFKADKPRTRSTAEAEARPTDHDDVIRDALAQMLERDVKGDFTKDGLPNCNAVSKVAGMNLAKVDVLRVFRAMQDEAGKADGVAE